jgi:hypothetical protein
MDAKRGRYRRYQLQIGASDSERDVIAVQDPRHGCAR